MRDAGSQRNTTAIELTGLMLVHEVHRRRLGGLTFAPLHPLTDRRPGLGDGGRADHKTEMAGADEVLVDIGLGGGAQDAAYRGRLADVVDLANDR
ncbi:Uncharacterised protein [Mycobacteroides abscessus]|nr:Uncharacterised protein [Mycobacteroides abscessus]